MDYPGKVITKTQVTPTQISASGNWTVDDAIAAVKNNNWPIAGVPNPIFKSLRFNSADTAYLSRTPASATNQKTWTWSAWVKRSVFGATKVLFDARASGSNPVHAFYFTSSDQLGVFIRNASATVIGSYNTSAVFRDPSAWYHITYKFDSTQATATNRVQIYVNGVLQTITASTTISQNADAFINSAISHGIGAEGVTPTDEFDGYMTEVNFVDSPVLVGSTTNASTTVTLTTGTTTNIGIGWNVGGTNIPSGATVSSITNSTQFVISAAATGTGSSISIGVAPPVSEFGLTNPQTGQWIPKKYTGTYGTNGFYLNFKDATSTTTLGYDYSGNANNWTTNNFSVTAGTGNDSLTDVPTPWFAYNTGDVGGIFRGNYCTMNPLTVPTLPTLANGNLDVSVSATGVKIAQGTFQFPSSGKWYYECTFNNASSGVNGMFIGITSPTRSPNATRSTAGAYFFYASSSALLNSNGSDVVTGLSTISANEVFKLAVDIDNSKVWIGRGSIWYNSSGGTTGDPAAGTNPTFSISANGFTPMSGFDASSVSLSMNFGQRQFNSTPPAGFRSLCTTNLPPPAIGFGLTNQADDYFNALPYVGNGTDGRTVTGVGFNPDLVWVKGRSNSGAHVWADAVRGSDKNLYSNLSDAETNPTTGASGGGIGTVTTDGFVLEQGTVNMDLVNTNTRTYVAWNWKAGGTTSTISVGQYSTSPNVPSIASTVSANTTSGFSVVTWAASGTNPTIGHGLGAVPSMIIAKSRNNAGYGWAVYHTAIGRSKFLSLEVTTAETSYTNYWGTANPTNTVFGTSDGAFNNNIGNMVAYCFADVEGYSKAFSYASNNSSDNAFVYLGFRPRWIMIKSSTTGGTNYDWVIYDTARMTYNYIANTDLRANLSGAEGSTARNPPIDILSNGFKVRGSGGEIGSSTLYVGMAFAEAPFQFANAR